MQIGSKTLKKMCAVRRKFLNSLAARKEVILYLSGHTGRDPVTAKLAPGGIEGETRQALANIREVLRAAGMDFKDVVTVTAFIANFNDFDKFNAVYREYFPTDPPARATVQVTALNIGARVELQMIAVKP